MSKLDRDFAREAGLRAKRRRAKCPDPKCRICGEERIARLVLRGYRPICGNCLADRRHDPGHDNGNRERFRIAGFPDPRCIACGEDKVWRLELDHIAGQKHDDSCAPLCCNCHAERTFMQSYQPAGGENPQNVLEVIGRFIIGIAEWFELIKEKLYEFGEYLIDLAK